MSEAKHLDRIKNIASVLLIAIFVGLLWMPLLDSFLHLDKAPTPNENRAPAKFPVFTPTFGGMKEFISGIDAYYTDHFGFRKRLIRWHHRWKRQFFNESTMSNVMIGRDGWLFFAGDNMIEYARATKPFTDADLENWRQLLEGRRNWLAKQDIKYIFVIPPDKHSIYREYLPDWVTRVGSVTRIDQFVAYMKEKSDVEVLDLRKPLIDAKFTQRTYLITDTHWNLFGAFIGYQELVKTLRKQFPDLEPLRLEQFEQRKAEQPGGDLAGMLNQQASITEPNYVWLTPKPPLEALDTVTETNLLNKPWIPGMEPAVTRNPNAMRKVIMFRDSFAGGWMPFLGYHFKEVIYIWQYNWDKPFIAQEKPDIVIDEMLERFLCRENPLELKEKDEIAGATTASHH